MRAEQSRAEQSRAEQSRAEQSRLDCVDFLKGIAILAVIAVHTAQSFTLPLAIDNIAKMGQLGCQLFFVISGFTVANSYCKKKQGCLSFYIKRWKSIAPGYYLMIVVYWGFDVARKLIGHDQNIQFWKGALVNALLLNGISPTYNNNIVPGGWFIGTTAIFYLLCPVLIKILKAGYRTVSYMIPVISSLVCLVIGCMYPAWGKNGSFFYYSFVVQMPSIILGIVLYFDWKNEVVMKKRKAIIYLFVFALLSVVLFYCDLNGAFMLIPLCSGSFFYVLFSLLLHSRGMRFVNMLGRKSYGMFLTHMFFAHQLAAALNRVGAKIGVDQTVLFLIALMVAVLGSYGTSSILNALKKKMLVSKL